MLNSFPSYTQAHRSYEKGSYKRPAIERFLFLFFFYKRRSKRGRVSLIAGYVKECRMKVVNRKPKKVNHIMYNACARDLYVLISIPRNKLNIDNKRGSKVHLKPGNFYVNQAGMFSLL